MKQIKILLSKIRPNFNKQSRFTSNKINNGNDSLYDELYRQKIKEYLMNNETKSSLNEVEKTIGLIYSIDKIDLKKSLENLEKDNKENVMKEMLEKAKVEESKITSNFFNEYSIKILENTSNENLLNIALKSFVGSIDIPKDVTRSVILLELIKSKLEEKDNIDIEFYLAYLSKINAEAENDKEKFEESSKKLISMRSNLKAIFVERRDFYNLIKKMFKKGEGQNNDYIMSQLYDIFLRCAEYKIYEAYYYLGLMNLEGDAVRKDINQAYRYFNISAGHNHAISYYKLYEMIREDLIPDFTDKPYKNMILFNYLKRSAEEGYVLAQYDLANSYITGIYGKIDLELALAWHRQACQNGFILSYEIAGDIYYNGGPRVRKNIQVSLIMYYCAYSKGMFNLKEKVLKVRNELVSMGENIPEMILI